MALDINGYNNVFKNFAEFAQKCYDAGDKKAIATVNEEHSLDGRKILSISNTFGDAVHFRNRGTDQKSVNDLTRSLFRKAVADMFSGEAKIPPSVKKAMLMTDYDKGKPLTARRIMAVKEAIDESIAANKGGAGSKPVPLDKIMQGSATKGISALFKGFKARCNSKNPAQAFADSMASTAKAEITTTIAHQIGEKFDPDASDTTFKADICRHLDITLGGRKLECGDFAVAREKMLQFVTGDATLTWAKATQAQKVRANIVMALCNQALAAVPKTALTDALAAAPDSNFMALSFEDRGGMSKEASYTVSKNDDGDITISLRDSRMVSAATLTKPDGEFEDVAFDVKSHVDYSLDLTIPKSNLDKLANADWPKYDHAPVEDADNGTKAGRLKAASMVPDAYRFEGRVEVKVAAHLDKA